MPGHGLSSLRKPCSSSTSWGKRSLGARVAPQRHPGPLVGPRRAAEPEVDPARVQRRQRPELLGDHQRRVVGQHDPAGAEPDRLGVGGDVGDQHRRRRGGDRRDVVVLGVPDPPVAARSAACASSTLPAKLSATVSSRPTAARSRIERGTVGFVPSGDTIGGPLAPNLSRYVKFS